MSAVEYVKRIFAVPEDPELVLAQARALCRQVPLMYAMVMANTLMLASTHFGVAPPLLAIYVPATLCVACTWRIASWWQGRTNLKNVEFARSSLRRMMRVMPILSVAFCAWTIAMLPYGDAYQQSQVVFFCGITTMGCMFCLMHVRAAALAMGALTLLPFVVTMLAMGHLVLIAMAINLAVVTVVMLIILLGNYRDFSDLVASRSAIAQKQIETQRLSDENERLANVDPLTELPNHRAFTRQLAVQTDLASQSGRSLAVARINLDGFKSINEIFGQISGDRVLAETGRRLMDLRPAGTFVARLEADNFALIVTEDVSENGLQELGTLLCQALSTPFDLPGANIHLSASIGLAASQTGDTADMTYDRADYVASVAKRECPGRAVVFAQKHECEISKVRRIEHQLHTADLDAEIYILFQPQFDVSLNRTTGYEVLARWRNSELGEISPVEFIPLAERSGLICKLTRTVLRKALSASARLPRDVRLSVNLSAHDIGSHSAIETIVALVEQSGTPCTIDFEITETAMMHDMTQAGESLLALLSLGSRIALDDFGTGHSSLTHVQKLPLDRIKIDRSFVADMCGDPTSLAIIKTVTELCRNLGISCVFEGVETSDQLEALTAMGGSVMQGYLFGRPVSEDAMLEQVARERVQWDAEPVRARGAAR
tara:strand:- start:149 stop:2128 length:1980 start_codon:yes stop_codon:yes gene_type:complete